LKLNLPLHQNGNRNRVLSIHEFIMLHHVTFRRQCMKSAHRDTTRLKGGEVNYVSVRAERAEIFF